jgi:hypothetical protein
MLWHGLLPKQLHVAQRWSCQHLAVHYQQMHCMAWLHLAVHRKGLLWLVDTMLDCWTVRAAQDCHHSGNPRMSKHSLHG